MHRDNDSNALAATLIARAEALAPTLAGRAAQDAQGRIPAETIADMQAAGFFKVLQPKRYGGYGSIRRRSSTSRSRSRAAACRPRGCTASSACTTGSSRCSTNARSRTWGDDPATLIASTYMPVGRVTPVDGGFRLSGHWKFSSGSELCSGCSSARWCRRPLPASRPNTAPSCCRKPTTGSSRTGTCSACARRAATTSSSTTCSCPRTARTRPSTG